MKNISPFNLDQCSLSNDLWPDFINKIGLCLLYTSDAADE